MKQMPCFIEVMWPHFMKFFRCHITFPRLYSCIFFTQFWNVLGPRIHINVRDKVLRNLKPEENYIFVYVSVFMSTERKKKKSEKFQLIGR